MDMQKLYTQLQAELMKYFSYSPQLTYSITIEIVARLFVLSLCELENKNILFDNIHNKYKGYFQELNNDVYESDLKTLRRFEKKLRQGHDANLRYYGIKNLYSVEGKLNPRRKGRTYDNANLEFVFSSLENSSNKLFSYLIKNMLTNSNKVSDSKFVEAYDAFDVEYENAKNCEDKIQYITKWINFCRMETKCHFSLIPKIADYMSKHKNMPIDNFVNFWGTGYIEKGKYIEAYQILRYEGYISYFEQSCCESMAQYILNERIVSSIVCNKFRKIANETFSSFYEGKQEAINEMYEFCHNIYPVIELHSSSNFYLSNGKLNRPKIKCARKIIDFLLCPDILSTFYKENTD